MHFGGNAHCRRDTHAHPDGHGLTDAHCNSDSDAHRNGDSHGDRYSPAAGCDAYAHGAPNRNAYANPHATGAHRDANIDTDAYGAYCDAVADTDCHVYADTTASACAGWLGH